MNELEPLIKSKTLWKKYCKKSFSTIPKLYAYL